MMNKFKFLVLTLCGIVAFSTMMSAQTVSEGTIAVSNAQLSQINLPSGARRIKDNMSPPEVKEVLAKLVQQGGSIVRQGKSEVLLWGGDYRQAKGEQMIKSFERDLQRAGWEYEVGAKEQGVTIFTLFRATPARRALVGFFAPSEEAFIFAVTEMLPANSTGADNSTTEKIGENPEISANVTDKSTLGSSNAASRPQLTGKWFRSVKKDISGLNGYTDATFEFYADGTMRSIVEDESRDARMCSIMSNSEISGTYTVTGDRLTMNLKAGTTTGKNSCVESGNFKKNLAASTITKTFIIKTMDSPFRPDSPALLCLDGAADKQCFERSFSR